MSPADEEMPLSSFNNDAIDEEEVEEEDLHLCGKCKSSFGDINDFVNHKKLCKKKTANSKRPENEFATDEAAVISLLANQLSSQNSQSRPSADDLDQFTFVFKDELDPHILSDPLPPLTPPKKKSTEKPRKASKPSTSSKSTIEKDFKGEKKQHFCSVVGCKYKSSHPKDLARHLRTHTGEKPFACKYCEKKFSRQDKRKNHEMIHTGEKPFGCELCPYKTADSGSLKKHMRIHLDERPYKCQLCPYRSRDSSQLTVHLRTHTNDRPFSCPFEPCVAAFKTNSDLKRHLKLHTCPHCSFKSGSHTELKNHIGTCHPDVAPPPSPASLAKKKQSSSFKCSFCDFIGHSKLSLISHRRKNHLKEKLIGSAEKRSQQKQRKKQKNKTMKVECVELSPFKKEPLAFNFSCNLCERTFIREDSFKSHLRQHQKLQEEKMSSNDILSLTDNSSVQYLLLPTATAPSDSSGVPSQEIHILTAAGTVDDETTSQVLYQMK